MKSIKWVGILLAVFLGILLIGVLVLYAVGQARLNKVYNVFVSLVPILDDDISLAEGKRIFQYRG